jgi:uncharacterized paraquat-inducible protein A
VIRMIKFHLLVATVCLVMVACTMVMDGYRFMVVMVMVVVMIVIVIVVVVVVMVVIQLRIPIHYPSSSVILGVEVERRTHRRRVWWIYDRALLLGRESGFKATVW